MFQDKKILILGMGKSGYEAAKLLSKYSSNITITDQKEQDKKHVEELKQLGVSYIVTDKPEELLFEDTDYLVKNPGIPKTHPCVLLAKQKKIPVINEVEVAYSLLKGKVKIVAITGSNGKTTTTTMIYEVMKKAGLPVHLGGNIGYPVCSLVNKVKPGDLLVLEISDHQLVDVYEFKADVSILTNLSQVHLDFHKDYETYKQVKKKIFAHQTKEDIAILNKDCEDCKNLCQDLPSKIQYFSKKETCDCYKTNDGIFYQGKKLLSFDDIRLKGDHNYENIMAMILAVKIFGVSDQIIQEYLKEFCGVEHRMEFVREVNGISYYNDSKSTNVDSTITALKSFQTPVLLILGGLDRGHSFDPLNPYLNHVKMIFTYGETKNRIHDWAQTRSIPCFVFETLKEATKKAIDVAEKGDTLLLSPACASWDQYDNFELRGEEFKKIIKEI